jgi:hypothetical protein
MSWKPGVHKLDGINLPRTVEYTLCVNLKYLFPVNRQPKVAFDWFDELVKKASLHTFFQLQGNGDSLWDQYRNDPNESWKMRLPFPKSSWRPTINENWFIEGVQAGREYLSRSLSGHSVPQLDPSQDILKRITLSPQSLRQYLTEARLLSFISDKNLGIVVVTQDWYEGIVDDFLRNPVFRRFPGGEAEFETFRWSVCQGLDTLRRKYQLPHGELLPFLSDKKMVSFWDECWIKKDLPRFHGIPKIHKNPWKLRPIVPMHSYVTSRLALILHHMLLPVQRSFNWICESSRNLASEVADFNKSLSTSTRLHTGDVTGMYTNIKWIHFRPALRAVLEDGEWYDEETRNWILTAADFLWRHTVFRSGTKIYQQVDGIPMGIHCGPVFANLFMARYEKYYLRNMPPDFFYRRYIDDCFVIDSSDERVENAIRCPGLDIQWAHSGHGISFLDVYFHTHPEEPGICFKPFEKALNHHQYLPWASSHPISVKKGMIKGELSRIRAICYKRSYFLTWKASFLTRLRLRGWPARALNSWARQVQWRNFFPSAGLDAKKTGSRIIAVSQYNPVWNQISSTDIWETMRTTWSAVGPPNLSYPSHVLVAKKRTRSMWDLVRSVNRNLLRKELEEFNIEELSDAVSSLDASMEYDPN